jgi:hydroxymethylbilane synthase
MIRFGSRGSDLALTQTRSVAEELKRLAGIDYTIEVIKTRGDQNLDDPLPEIGGKGLFTSELEKALREQRIDVAVHSLKDLPVEDPQGLTNGAIPQRELVHDVLLFDPECRDPEGGTLPLLGERVVGTSSPRRSSSVLALRADLIIQDIRGNVETRARKVSDHRYDATILAAAGLNRLALSTPDLDRVELPVDAFTPAPGQGALGIQCRVDDEDTKAILASIHDPVTAACVNAERRLLWLLGGGCSMPLGALVRPDSTGNYEMLVSLFSESHPSCGTRLTLAGDTPATLADQAASQLRPLLNNPLAGHKIVLLRPGGIGGHLSNALQLAGAEVDTVTVSETFPVPVTDGRLTPHQGSVIAFTSARAVDRFFEESAVNNFECSGTHFFAIGSATAMAVRARGFPCQVPSHCGGGKELAEYLIKQTGEKDIVLYPCAQDRHPGFEAELRAAGRDVHPVPVYKTQVLTGIEIPASDHLVFTSPSAVRSFVQSGATATDSNLLAFGQTTADAMHSAGLNCRSISPTPTAQALVGLIQGLSSNDSTS